MIKTAGRLAACLTVAILAGCSSSSDSAELAATTGSTPTATTQAATDSPGSTSGSMPPPEAQAIVEAFATAGLPVPNPRDNSANTSCTDIGCIQLITTDAISVYVFGDHAAARRFAEALGPESGYQAGTVVLSYGAARTPVTAQPRYEAVLAATVGG